MRLHFQLSANQEPVPFEYQHFLTGAFNKWLGYNKHHDDISLYSLSWLFGGSFRDGALYFPRGAGWFLSIYDESLIPEFEDAVLSDPQVCCGMKVLKIRKQDTPVFGSRYLFKVGSPVLAKSKEVEGKVKHYTFANKEADEVMTATLLHKMDVAGLGEAEKKVSVKFDRTFKFARTKLVKIRNIKNRASECPVIIEGAPTALGFAWNVGIGHGTGSGFGSLL